MVQEPILINSLTISEVVFDMCAALGSFRCLLTGRFVLRRRIMSVNEINRDRCYVQIEALIRVIRLIFRLICSLAC